MEIRLKQGLLAPQDLKSSAPVETVDEADKDTIRLRLLATSDLHVHILPFDYYTGLPADRLGLARTASLIVEARGEVENCLLFDNGDFLQGSPLGDFVAQVRGLQTGDVHPVVAAMNALGYDAGTLGNHEFNYGLDFLTTALAGAAFPIVTANVQRVNDLHADRPLALPYVILDRSLQDENGTRHPVRIGVTGFTPPQIMIWDRDHLDGKLTAQDIVEAATRVVRSMKADGADLIIALSHSGIGAAEAFPGQENSSTALAKIAGIDAVIAGHSHLVFPSDDFSATPDIDPVLGTLCGKPAVMPGFYGSHLGVIDLFLSHERGRFKVIRHTSQARPIWTRDPAGSNTALTKSHAGVEESVAALHRDTLEWASLPIGQTDVPLHSFFALVTESPALQLVANAQAQHVAQLLAGTVYSDLPILTSVAPFKAGGRGGPENYTDVAIGDVLLRDAADLYMHPNTSAALRMTGAEMENWLHFAAGIFNQVIPGSTDIPLVNPDFPSFNFDIIYGLGFQIDLREPPKFDLRGGLINPDSRRIADVTYQGAPLQPAMEFAVATNSYRLSVKTEFLGAQDDRLLFQSQDTIRDVVRRHFVTSQTQGSDAKTGLSGQRRFAPMAGTSVTFDTSPTALAHTASLNSLKIEPLSLTQSGFLRFRLHL